ncbi:uncharacterized protein LOC117102503 [Anneissia japonica]|uniref:uncharacterized protein LOC117102503 n=1 Tax=Anneissia japonica TaxID=1529436 RepID=UPI0014258959|nr:uncharacterized protein LOC117102503 [Anneissia japonica]
MEELARRTIISKQVNMMLTYLFISVLLASNANGLTRKEIRRFKADTYTEQNTGLQGTVSVTTTQGTHTIVSNGIPDHATADYPTQRNPNNIIEQSYSFTVPKNPSVADQSTALNMGPIGIAVNGIPFYNPWTRENTDAVESETFDECDGHPDGRGRYHYHKMPSSCVFNIRDGIASTIIGVALDGFPIYGPIDEDGTELTSADLDDCHGKVSSDGSYRYHTTEDFPYILGCYRGTVNN